MFELHPRLAADTVPVTDWPLCRVLLMNDRHFPWLVLVPRRPGVVELHQLEPGDAATLMGEVTTASHRLAALTRADKINVAALGNVVPQLHVHVIARFTTDPAWPRPVWGVLPAAPYDAQALSDRVGSLRRLLEGEG
jgi:diadenosine tetraphosphate (Ap4A) HIT family hydrolase